MRTHFVCEFTIVNMPAITEQVRKQIILATIVKQPGAVLLNDFECDLVAEFLSITQVNPDNKNGLDIIKDAVNKSP